MLKRNAKYGASGPIPFRMLKVLPRPFFRASRDANSYFPPQRGAMLKALIRFIPGSFAMLSQLRRPTHLH